MFCCLIIWLCGLHMFVTNYVLNQFGLLSLVEFVLVRWSPTEHWGRSNYDYLINSFSSSLHLLLPTLSLPLFTSWADERINKLLTILVIKTNIVLEREVQCYWIPGNWHWDATCSSKIQQRKYLDLIWLCHFLCSIWQPFCLFVSDRPYGLKLQTFNIILNFHTRSSKQQSLSWPTSCGNTLE